LSQKSTGGGPGDYNLRTFADHPVTRGLQSIRVCWPHSLEREKDSVALASSDGNTWRDDNRDQRKDSAEKSGPFDIFVASEVGLGCVLAGGDECIFTFTYASQADNAKFVMNALAWLAKQK